MDHYGQATPPLIDTTKIGAYDTPVPIALYAGA